MAAIVLGSFLIGAGYLVIRTKDNIYAAYSRILGSGAFPGSGSKHDQVIKFLRDVGWVVCGVGALIGLLGLYRLVFLI